MLFVQRSKIDNREYLTITVNTQSLVLTDPNAPEYLGALKVIRDPSLSIEEKEKQLLSFIQPFLSLSAWSEKTMKLEAGQLVFEGYAMPENMAKKLSNMAQLGKPYKNWLKFWEKLLLNPSKDAQYRCFDFISDNSIGINDDGYILAYKAIRPDGMDIYSGTMRCEGVVSVPRESVNADSGIACAEGLHVGSFDYALSYGQADSALTLVRVHPADVVTVPKSECQKMRVCKYEVVAKCCPKPHTLEEFEKRIVGPQRKSPNTFKETDFNSEVVYIEDVSEAAVASPAEPSGAVKAETVGEPSPLKEDMGALTRDQLRLRATALKVPRVKELTKAQLLVEITSRL